MNADKREIFKQLKSILSSFVPPLSARNDTTSRYDLYGKKKAKLGTQETDGMYFASAIIQKNFVGFYFFPIYTHREHFADVPDGLKKCLKGKSCFHMKKMDDALLDNVRRILEKGITLYKKLGWI